MHDPLFIRAKLAINDSVSIQEARRKLLREQETALYDLRWAVYETALARAHSARSREDREQARLSEPRFTILPADGS
jgi:hypothetical protein